MLKNFFRSPEGENPKLTYYSTLELRAAKLFSSFDYFTKSQSSTSILLLVSILMALALANSPWTDNYFQFINSAIGLAFNQYIFVVSVEKFVNDGLLVLFFFILGLEIKRELIAGELADFRKAILVIIMAMGGMAVPALIFYAINHAQPTIHGWGIPIATDTALAVGVFMLLRNKVPIVILTLLVGLAVMDDIGAVLIIALFYSENISIYYLLLALGTAFILLIMNIIGIRRATPYLIIGSVLWILIEFSGLHATVAGIIIALLAPARPATGPRYYAEQIQSLVNEFRDVQDTHALENHKQQQLLERVEQTTIKAAAPLMRWGLKLEKPVMMLVVPLFAFVNAGIILSSHIIAEALTSPLGLGIFLGLVIGKPLGITSACWLMIKLKLCQLPKGLHFHHVVGMSILCGIGFTMSVFITQLSFENAEYSAIAISSIMLASLVSASLGYVYLVFSNKHHSQQSTL